MNDRSLPGDRGGVDVLPPPSARSLLLSVAGEMLGERPTGAWTTALLRVFAGLGIDDHAGRQVLARSAAAGWLTRERVGRAVRWHLDAPGWVLIEEGLRRSAAYLAADGHWDGRWLVLHVTVPQQQRMTRRRLYGGLHWLGLGNFLPGLWITPHVDRLQDLRRLVAGLDLDGSAFAVVGDGAGVGISDHEVVRRAWDLTDLEAAYARLLEQEANAPEPGGADHVLLSYLRLLNLQQRFMRWDPQLPVELLPEWVGREGAALFRELRARWREAAHRRFDEIADECAPARLPRADLTQQR